MADETSTNALPDATGSAGYSTGEVTPPDAPRWTVMIFMGATTIDGSEPLIEAAKDDLKEIATIGGGGKAGLQTFVQVHGDGPVPKRYHFAAGRRTTPDGDPVPEHERNYEDGRALSDFIRHSLMESGHRRQDHAMLVLWGHAYDFAFGRSLTPGGALATLDFAAISAVLRRLQDKVQERFVQLDPDAAKRPKPPTLDIIGFDACDISTVELAYQLRPLAKFLLSSQIGIPMPGWPYHRILDRLQNPYGDVMSPPELGSYAVRRFCAAYDPSSPVTLTLVNLELADQLYQRAEAMATELAIAIENPEARARIIDCFFQSQTEPGKPFVDVADLCLNLLAETEYPRLVQHARALGDLIAGHSGNATGLSKTWQGWRLVAEHGRNSGDLVRLNGLSLYAPHVAPPRELDVARERYGQFELARTTRWSAAVHRLAALM
jgi:hypothetical protein